MNIFYSSVLLLGTALYVSADSVTKPQMSEHFVSAVGDAARLAVLVDEATLLLKTSADAAFTYLYDGSEDLTLKAKADIMGLLYDDIVATGVDPSADDAMVQLKSTRLVLKMKKAYEELQNSSASLNGVSAFAEDDGIPVDTNSPVLKDKFVDASGTSELLTLMEQVEELVLANDVDGAYSFMFHTSNHVTLGDKIVTFTKLFNNIKVEGVNVSQDDALVQVQSTIVVIEILRIMESQSGSDLTSFLESGNWEAASNLIQNPASFDEALDVLPLAASSEIKAKLSLDSAYKVQEMLMEMRKKIDTRLVGLNVEDDRGEIQFSYDMLDLLDYLKEGAPHNMVKEGGVNV